MLRIKRTYDRPARGDGRRLLVERLWPRGMKKEDLAAASWMKEVAPSTELRRWFSHRVDRWRDFRRRYRKELDANPGAWEPILDAERRGTVTLLYSARDTLRNGALVLCEYLVERSGNRPSGARLITSKSKTGRVRKSTTKGRSVDKSRRRPDPGKVRSSHSPSAGADNE
jgi:uncharacterized protein YeaO (DUF488 family)